MGGDAGLYYDPEKRPEIEDTILRFFADTALRGRLTAAALPRAAGFSWDRAAELGEACFRRCYSEAAGIPR